MSKNSLNVLQFEALLDQAFLELDLEHPKNSAILEASSQWAIHAHGSATLMEKNLFQNLISQISFRSIVFVLSLIVGLVVLVAFYNSKNSSAAHESSTSIKSTPVTEPVIALQNQPVQTKEQPAENDRPKENIQTTFLAISKDTLNNLTRNKKEEELILPTYGFAAPFIYPLPSSDEVLPYLPLTDKEMKEINKSMVKVGKGLFASDVEISNKRYVAFLNSLKLANRKKLLAIAQIDTLKWSDDSTGFNSPYVKYYHTHPAYQEYPCVNISYEAAKLYCEWLTEQYNSSERREFNKVKFRLPTEQEWMKAARGGDSLAIYPWAGKELRNKKGNYMCNSKRPAIDYMGVAAANSDNADVTAPVYSYWPNKFKLFCMSGNVGEMVDEKGILKGGSWIQTEEYLKIDAKYRYDGNVKNFIGFRYFVEVIIF